MFQRWLDDFAQTLATSCNMLVLDNGAFHTAKGLRWPANVAAGPLPPYSPELNPIERLWRDLKDQLATLRARTLDDLSDTVCRLIQGYSQAALKSLTGFAYFVQAVQMALQTTNG
jgi:putative transposase